MKYPTLKRDCIPRLEECLTVGTGNSEEEAMKRLKSNLSEKKALEEKPGYKITCLLYEVKDTYEASLVYLTEEQFQRLTEKKDLFPTNKKSRFPNR